MKYCNNFFTQNVFYLSDISHKMLMLKQNEVYRANDEALCRDWVDAINHSRYVHSCFYFITRS